MKPREECTHEVLIFGSGDYYIFCHECGARWAATNHGINTADIGDPSVANKGVGALLSGVKRYDYEVV